MTVELADELRRASNAIYLCVEEVAARAISDLFLRAADAVDPNKVRMPTTVLEAELMQKIGFHYIAEHAPERLTQAGREKAEDYMAAKNLYSAAMCGLSTLLGMSPDMEGGRIQFIREMLKKHDRFASTLKEYVRDAG
jgi:hypothetical protein